MPKLKTPQSIAKRFRVKKPTKNRLLVIFDQVKAGQSHFNGKESGTITRRKRGYKRAHKTNQHALKRVLTYLK